MKTLTALLCLAAVACGSIEPDPRPADDRGRLLTTGTDIASLTWTPDGSELVFVGNLFKVMAVGATGGSARTLYSSSISVGAVRVAGSNVYAVVPNAGIDAGARIVRIPVSGAVPDTVISRSGSVRSYEFAVSADERFIAFADSLHDLANGTRRVLPRGFAWSFSRDGSQLLWEAELANAATELHLIATSDLSSQTLVKPTEIARHEYFLGAGAHHWTDNDPHILRVQAKPGSDVVTCFLFNARTGADREVGSITTDAIGLLNADVSGNGMRVVVFEGPFFRWTQLHSIDAASGSAQVRATVSGDGLPFVTEVRLSPDGRKAAYVVSEGGTFGESGIPKLYVVEVAP